MYPKTLIHRDIEAVWLLNLGVKKTSTPHSKSPLVKETRLAMTACLFFHLVLCYAEEISDFYLENHRYEVQVTFSMPYLQDGLWYSLASNSSSHHPVLTAVGGAIRPLKAAPYCDLRCWSMVGMYGFRSPVLSKHQTLWAQQTLVHTLPRVGMGSQESYGELIYNISILARGISEFLQASCCQFEPKALLFQHLWLSCP